MGNVLSQLKMQMLTQGMLDTEGRIQVLQQELRFPTNSTRISQA